MTSFLSESLKLSENARTVLTKRYLKRDKDGNPVEFPEDMFLRVAQAIASGDKFDNKSDAEINELAEKFYKIITSLQFMPNSPTLMNAGRELGQLLGMFCTSCRGFAGSNF